jgi:hypothetical protein
MSTIQQLRDKSTVLLTGFIALSLIGFLVQDAFILATIKLILKKIPLTLEFILTSFLIIQNVSMCLKLLLKSLTVMF